MKQELTKIEKSHLMARMEIFLKERNKEELLDLVQLIQSKALLSPEVKYLTEIWGMIELALKDKEEVH